MHPAFDWSWSTQLDCGPTLTAIPQPTPASYFSPDLSTCAKSLAPANMAAAGRKRSRDETLTNDDHYDSSDVSRGSVSPPKIRPTGFRQDSQADLQSGPVAGYGDLQASTSFASARNGIWAEEVSEKLRSSSLTETQRTPPALESRKSARLEHRISGTDETRSGWHIHRASGSSIEAASSQDQSSRGHADGPSYDVATMTLGIGWSLLPASEAMQAAVRGWSAFIEQRYPLTSVKFEWEKRSEPRAYLVGAVNRTSRAPGYFLFQEDLQCCKLIAKSWERALDNLRALPMRFDGDNELQATDPAIVAAEQRERERLLSSLRTVSNESSMHQPSNLINPAVSDMAEPYIMAGMQGHIHQGHVKDAMQLTCAQSACASSTGNNMGMDLD